MAVALTATFIAGYFAYWPLRPERMSALWAKYVDGQPSHKYPAAVPRIAEVMETDYARLLTLHSPADVAARRRQVINYLWHGRSVGYGALRPDGVERDQVFLPLADLAPKAAIDRLTVTLPFGVVSDIAFLRARQSRSCLMLYQEGHRVSFLERKLFLERMIDAGCDVLALSFPLTGGLNSRPVIDHPRFGRILLNDPDDLQLLDSGDQSYLYYFIAPMVAALNHALGERSYDRVGATGFSGGGWAVSILAAIDPRIRASYAVAGSAPISVLAARPEWGSPEQHEVRFFQIATYPELYTMAGAGPDRRHLQFFNVTDPCCYSGGNWAAYASVVAERAAALHGFFSVATYQVDAHRMTASVGATIERDFLSAGLHWPLGEAVVTNDATP